MDALPRVVADVSPVLAVPQARKGGRVGLTTASVIAEAARLADETGDSRVPLATVADRLGVRLPSLYKHVAGVDGVRRGLGRLAAEGLLAEVDAALETIGRHGTDDDPTTLRALAKAWRGWASAHPGLYTALGTPPHPDDAEHAAAVAALTERMLRVIERYGVSGDEALVDGVRLLRAALHGFVTLEASGGLGVADGVDRTFERLLALLDAGLRADPSGRPRPLV